MVKEMNALEKEDLKKILNVEKKTFKVNSKIISNKSGKDLKDEQYKIIIPKDIVETINLNKKDFVAIFNLSNSGTSREPKYKLSIEVTKNAP
jgi:ABC-type lipoprotein release transport system permease subunit